MDAGRTARKAAVTAMRGPGESYSEGVLRLSWNETCDFRRSGGARSCSTRRLLERAGKDPNALPTASDKGNARAQWTLA